MILFFHREKDRSSTCLTMLCRSTEDMKSQGQINHKADKAKDKGPTKDKNKALEVLLCFL